jgi:hypothetical protein
MRHARRILLAGLVASGCAAARPAAPLGLPSAPPGTVAIVARALPPAGDVTAIEVAISSEHEVPLVLDRKQVFGRLAEAGGMSAQRTAPLGSAEAARRAGSAGLPAAARSSAYGAAEGGVRGAATGAITGGGAGGMVGAAVGAIGGVFRGLQDQPPDVAGFEDRALATTTLRAGMSVDGLVYLPLGDYAEVEIVLVGDDEVLRLLVPVAPPPAED